MPTARKPTLSLYGLKNCDSCRKAWKWLDQQGVSYQFLDIRTAQNTATVLDLIARAGSWEAFVNKRSTTWRGLPAQAKDALDEQRALALLSDHATLIKRPVIVYGKQLVAGFDAAKLAALLA